MLTKIFCFQHSEAWGHRRNVYQAVHQIAPALSVLAIPAYIRAALLHMFIYVLTCCKLQSRSEYKQSTCGAKLLPAQLERQPYQISMECQAPIG